MKLRSVFAAVLALAAAGTAAAHDTWFERRAGGLLALGTGNSFPLQETPLDASAIAQSGCSGGRALKGLHGEAQALILQPAEGAGDCWAASVAFDLELEPALIAVYLREVRPPPAVLAAWDAMRARGLPWKERYTKQARIALLADGLPMAPSGMPIDAVIESRTPFVVRVLRDGKPYPAFNVELRHERARHGVWRRTDDEGRIVFEPPLAGAWLLRGIDLRPAGDGWESRFLSLAFEVRTPAARR